MVRVVVTGMGVVSCLGHDVDLFYNNLCAGKSGIATIDRFPCDQFPTRFAGIIKEFDPSSYIEHKLARRIDPFLAYAIVASKKALEQGNLASKEDKERCGVLIGSGMGGMKVFVDGVAALAEKGYRRVTPFFVPYILTNMAGALVAIELGWMGPNYSISTACATANHAIIAAANHIRLGEADVMLAGGSEAAILPMGLAGFTACRALSQRNEEPEKASRPWDKDRDGFVLGEGAGVLLLESYDHAKARNAPILAEILGSGISCDAHHITEPRPDGAGIIRCINLALKAAALSPEDVDHINAHATSTQVGDMAEINALKKIFKHPERIIMTANKSMIGHCLGAAAGIEAVATIQTLLHNRVPPTINLDNPEPDLAFHIPHKAEDAEIKVALSNSFGFGGHNATLLFGKLT